jgi:acetyl esterase/lipase
MNWLLLGMALFNLGSLVCMFYPRPVYRSHVFILVLYAFSLLGTELAWIWLLLQVVLASAFIYAGALGSATGLLGLGILLLTWPGLALRHWQSLRLSGQVVENALRSGLGQDYREAIPPAMRRGFRTRIGMRDWVRPLGFRRGDVERIADIPYLPGGVRQRLDIYRPKHRPADGCPVLLQIHGGGWMLGHKAQQALPLMHHMAGNGWVCVAVNYRLSPSVGFPAHLEDCKAALCWIREHGREYGMNPDFVAVTGGSAGGHLAALMGLTANQPDLQKLHPQTDTSVQACVPFYGEYDFLTAHADHPMFEFIDRTFTESIMHVSRHDDPALWQLASPITQVHEDAPPFLVIHGDLDSLLPVAKARTFSQVLKGASTSPVVYVEMPGADHGFEIVRTVRAEYAIDGVHRFLEWVRARQPAAPAFAEEEQSTQKKARTG